MSKPPRRYRINKDSWTVLRDILVAYPEDFNSPTTHTLWGRQGWWPMGRLPEEWRARYKEARDSDAIYYTIGSFGTPIAWQERAGWNRDGTVRKVWIVPNVKYSITTTKHQGKVRTALSQIEEGTFISEI